MNLEDLRIGAPVQSNDGHKVGSLSRFVIHRDSHRLTHLVVDTGIFRSGEPLWKGGWGMSHDRVVPLGVVASATSNELVLTMSAEEFRDQTRDFAEDYFERIEDTAPGRLNATDLTGLLRSIPGEPGPYVMYDTQAKEPDEVDIGKGSPVWRLNPHQKLGEVERVIFEGGDEKVTAIVVKRGHVFTKEVVLPFNFVTEVVGDIVRVDIDDASLHALAEFTD